MTLTRMVSASLMVERRCATMTVVTLRRSAARLRWIDASVNESSALVACMRACGQATVKGSHRTRWWSSRPPRLALGWRGKPLEGGREGGRGEST